jgi:hypothetical protein
VAGGRLQVGSAGAVSAVKTGACARLGPINPISLHAVRVKMYSYERPVYMIAVEIQTLRIISSSSGYVSNRLCSTKFYSSFLDIH